MDNYFYRAGDLENIETKDVNEKSYFYKATDLDVSKNEITIKEKNINNDFSDENINNYLQNIVSGITYDFENEFGTICSEGNIIVSFKELQDMIETGEYNIISANYFNKDMVEIKYQQFSKNKNRGL